MVFAGPMFAKGLVTTLVPLTTGQSVSNAQMDSQAKWLTCVHFRVEASDFRDVELNCRETPTAFLVD